MVNFTASVELTVPLHVLVIVRFGASTASVAEALTPPGLLLPAAAVAVLERGRASCRGGAALTWAVTLAPAARVPMASLRVPPLMLPPSVVQARWAESGSGSLRLTL